MGKKKDKFIPKDEFRYNFSQKHKNYVFAEVGNKFKSVGLTHDDTTFGKINMPLNKNPQNGKTEKSYIRNGIISDNKRSYGKPLNNYAFDESDRLNVKSKIRNYKKRNKKGK